MFEILNLNDLLLTQIYKPVNIVSVDVNFQGLKVNKRRMERSCGNTLSETK